MTMKLLYFILLNVSLNLAQKDPNFVANRSVIIHLFDWKWTDIAEECERFLQYKGYAGVQISPPNENIIVEGRPWWERYQPVTYNLTTRSGNEDELTDMITRCNKVGIRIYAEILINHMAGLIGTGTAGNKALSDVKVYPGIGYNPEHFHPTCNITNYLKPDVTRNCQLKSNRDLDQSIQYVREKILAYMNGLIDLGVAGFRIDSAKYVWPDDLKAIYAGLKNLSTSFGFQSNSRPFIYQDVPTFNNDVVGTDEYVDMGVIIEYKYSSAISKVFRGQYNLSELENWGPEWDFIASSQDALVFVDNNSNQRKEGTLNYKTLKLYKMALIFMLAHDYGIPRIISSYFFSNEDMGIDIFVEWIQRKDNSIVLGPPQDSSGKVKSPIIYSDGTCGNGYVCEHRWSPIVNMIEFRNIVSGTEIENWWSNQKQQIAFSRGNKGFIVFTNGGNITENIQTSLLGGTYCDIISGDINNGTCTGKSLVVNNNGIVSVSLLEDDFNGVLAVHINSKL